MWTRALHYSLDLPTQTYTEPVPLRCGKLATKYRWIYTAIFTVYACVIYSGGERWTRADPAEVSSRLLRRNPRVVRRIRRHYHVLFLDDGIH